MTSRMLCDCGNQLRVSAHHAGRLVQCPVCGKSCLVTIETLTASPRSIGDEAVLPAGSSCTALPSARRKWRLPLAALLLALAVGAATWWLLFREDGRAKDGDDMLLIPGNAQGFVSIRLADLWKTPAMQKALRTADNLAARMEAETGLRPEEVERLSGVIVDMDDRVGWLVVRTVEPYDMKKVLARLTITAWSSMRASAITSEREWMRRPGR